MSIYLDEKGPSVKTQFPNIFKDHQIVAKPRPTTVADEWPLSSAFRRNFYNSHGKYKPELNEYFHMYRCQLNFSLFTATSALRISGQHLSHPNLLVRAVYILHVYFHVLLVLDKLHFFWPLEDGFNKVKNDYEDSGYCSVCDEYDVDPTETWMCGNWVYTTDFAVFGHEVRATERSLPDNLTRWIITQSKDFTKNGIKKISRTFIVYVYLVLSFQVKARSTIANESAPAVDAQKVFKDTFNDLIREDLSIDTEKYQGVLEHALSKITRTKF